MRISDWSSDVCSSDLDDDIGRRATAEAGDRYEEGAGRRGDEGTIFGRALRRDDRYLIAEQARHLVGVEVIAVAVRSEEHTSELQSLMRISYAVFCLKKKNHNHRKCYKPTHHRRINGT